MALNKIKITGIIILTAVLFSAVFFYWAKNRKTAVELKIDQIEDIKGLGYTGQRKIAVDTAGNYFVAYRKKYQGKSEIFVQKISFQKGNWNVTGSGSPVAFVGSPADQRVPSIAVDSNNNIVVVWYGSDVKGQPNNRQVKYVQSSDGGKTWPRWKNISEVQGYKKQDYWQEHPYILAGENGILYVVWEGKDLGNSDQQIKFSKSSDGGMNWSSWKNIQPTADNTQSRPTLVQDKNGTLHLFMYSSEGNSNDLQQIKYATSSNQGNTWSQWQSISDPSVDCRHATATVDTSGAVHVAWRAQGSPGPSKIMYRSLKNGSWSEEMRQAAISSNFQLFPNISSDSKGEISLVWMESSGASSLPNEDPVDGKIFKAKMNTDGIFSAPLEISAGDVNLYPQLPEKSGDSGIPVLYESAVASNKYELFFKFIK